MKQQKSLGYQLYTVKKFRHGRIPWGMTPVFAQSKEPFLIFVRDPWITAATRRSDPTPWPKAGK